MAESVVNELGDLFNLGVSVAAPAAGFALTGNPGVPVTSAAYIAGTKGRKDSKIIRNESLSGALFGTFAHYTLLPLQALSSIAKVAYMIPWVFGANAFFMTEDHLIKNKSPKGLYKKFKEDYLQFNRRAFKSSALINIAASLFVPQRYLVTTGAAASYVFRRFVAGDKGEEQTDKTPYLVAASNVTGRLAKNVFYGVPQAAYGIASSIGDYLKRKPREPTQTRPPARTPTPEPA